MGECTHRTMLHASHPGTEGCAECVASGDTWVSLRVCVECGHVGCCDSSKNRHARKHYHETGHPLIVPKDDPDSWAWCYVDNTYVDG